MKYLVTLLFALLTLSSHGATSAIVNALRRNYDTTGTNTTTSAVTVSGGAGTNLYAGTLNATNSVNVGVAGQAGLITLTSTNGTYSVTIGLASDGTLQIKYGSTNMLTVLVGANALNTGDTNTFLNAGGYYSVAGANINPTDLRMPYRSNSTTFGDGPWSYIAAATNALGFNSTNFALFIGDFDVALGHDALGVQASEAANTGVGTQSLAALNGGNNNEGFGYRSLFSLTTGSENVGVGLNALLGVQTGSDNVGVGNTALGSTTGDRNTAIGSLAGRTNAASANIFIGYNANPLASTDTNHIVIGYEAVGNGDNTITLGNTTTTDSYLPLNLHLDYSPTNVIYRSTTDLVYTNGLTGGSPVSLQVIDGSGNVAYFQVVGNVARVRGASVDLYDGSTTVRWNSGILFPTGASSTLGTGNFPWQDGYISRHIVWNGSTNTVFDMAGSGSPEGVVTADPGSTYRNFSGGATNTFWVKESGAGNTGWVNK